MPIIKPRTNRVRTVRLICRLQEPNRDTLLLYARFIGDTVDYVLNQLIESTLGKDREFVTWRAGDSTGATGSSAGASPSIGPAVRPITSADSKPMRVLVEYRFVLSLALASTAGSLGLHAWPWPSQDPILGFIHERRPELYAVFQYGYCA